jgi:hypothetical protein
VVLGAVIVLGMMGGCSGATQPDVASLSEGAAPAEVSPAEAIEALVACLNDAGIPALIGTDDDGDTHLEFVEGHNVAGGYASGLGFQVGDPDESLRDGFSDSVAGTDYLFADGADQSATWQGCLALSGYVEPATIGDPAEEFQRMQVFAQATNEWTACAREHGLHQLADVTAVQDDWDSIFARLPATLSVAELHAVLDACPNFDAKAMEADDESRMAGLGGTGYHRPSIMVEDPHGAYATGSPEEPTTDEGQHIAQLYDLLDEPWDRYYRTASPGG